jgi:CelD/BcsL family acetyltransferase involved in cellulose biosynthesis
MLQADIVRPRDLSLGDRDAWAAFRDATPAFRLRPLLSLDFAEAVGDHRADAAVAVLRRAGRPVGFLPHHRRPGGLARPMGATWSDYHALVAAPDAQLDGGEVLRAAGLTAFRFGALLDPYGAFTGAQAAPHDAFRIALDGDGDAYLEALRAASPKRFKNLRRLEHKLARELGEPTLVAPDHDPAAFALLVQWKKDQFRRTGLHDVLSPAWSDELMHALFERREGPLQGLMITLRVDGRLIAAHFGVRQGEAYHPWLAAYDPALFAYSPGITFLTQAIRAMPRLGLASYDLSAGGDHYKRPFASDRAVTFEGALRVQGGGLQRSLGLIAGVLPPGPARTVRRMGRRMDHIATAELSLGGRVQGLAVALAATSRRLEAQVEGEG